MNRRKNLARVALATAGLLASGTFGIGQVLGSVIVLQPNASVRLENPEEGAELRWVVQFELPEDVSGNEVIMASLHVHASAIVEVGLIARVTGVVGTLPQTWHEASLTIPTWSEVQLTGQSFALGTNPIDFEVSPPIPANFELDLTGLAREWWSSSESRSLRLWVRIMPGSAPEAIEALSEIAGEDAELYLTLDHLAVSSTTE